MNITYLQQFFKMAADNSCYACCVIKLACKINKTDHNLTNIGKALDIGFDKKYLGVNEKDYSDYGPAFTVYNAEKWLTDLTGKKVSVRTEGADYKCKKDEYEFLFYAKTPENASKGIGHFIFDGYDPYKTSVTVATGKVYSKRIIKVG